MDERERRTIPATIAELHIETRAVKRADGEDAQQEVITGKAVVFNQLSQNLGWFREQIDPRAFDDCDMSDVVCLKNHDNNLPLGRTADSLTLEVKADGLYFVAVPPATQNAKDTLEEIRAKVIRGCSFQFMVAPGGRDWDTDPETGGEISTVKRISRLLDVGPVTFPAYLQTDTAVAKRDHDSARQEQRKEEPPFTGIPLSTYQRRARELAL